MTAHRVMKSISSSARSKYTKPKRTTATGAAYTVYRYVFALLP